MSGALGPKDASGRGVRAGLDTKSSQHREANRSEFDVVVIGATCDGFAIAESIAARGADVALVDHDPDVSRHELAWAMLRRSLVRDCAAVAEGHVSSDPSHRIRMEIATRFTSAMRAAKLEHDRRCRINSVEMKIITGRARFSSRDTLEVGETLRLAAGAFVVATGSRPRMPAGRFGDCEEILTAPDFLRRSSIPRSLAIVGADWSGCEWACALAMLGCSVHLIDRRTRLLRSLDSEIRLLVQQRLHELGVEITLGEEVRSLVRGPHGAIHLELGSGRTEVAEAALLLSGEIGNTADLDLANAGVALDPQGHVLVDDRGRSSVPSILAVGSVVDSSGLFSSPRSHVMRIAGNSLGSDEPLDSVVPWNLYASPAVAACGMTAESCLRLDLRILLGRHAAGPPGAVQSLLHLVVDRDTLRILGAQAAGTAAFEIVQVLADSINREEPIDAIVDRLADRDSDPTSNAIRNACIDAMTTGNRTATEPPR